MCIFLPDEDEDPLDSQHHQYRSDFQTEEVGCTSLALSVKASRHHFYFADNNEETIQFIWDKITEIKTAKLGGRAPQSAFREASGRLMSFYFERWAATVQCQRCGDQNH